MKISAYAAEKSARYCPAIPAEALCNAPRCDVALDKPYCTGTFSFSYRSKVQSSVPQCNVFLDGLYCTAPQAYRCR